VQRSFMHRVRSFVVSALHNAVDAVVWIFRPVPSSVKNWLTVLFLGVVLLDIGLAYVYVVPSLENRLVHQKLNDLSGRSYLVYSAIANAVSASNPVDLSNMAITASVIDAQINARVVVIDRASLTTLVDSRRGLPMNIANYPVVAAAIKSGRVTIGEATIGATNYATAAVPVSTELPSFHGIVLVSTPLTDLDRAVASVEHQILFAGGLALIATLFAGYLASYFIARRLKRIERGALSIASGDLSHPVLPGPPDEIGQLAVTFNMMGGRLREAFSQIEREKENVEVMLYDLAEGVIGVTAAGGIAVANPAAAALLGRALPSGAALADILPPDVAQALVETQVDGDDRTIVVEFGARSLEASVYRVAHEAEVRNIVVLRDITEQARLDAARRDFIATASHELKTPLFSLSGFMELIDEGELDADTEKEFLSLMRQQVDRLTDLSLSLLDLSQVDSGAVRLEAGDIDITTLTRAVIAEFRPGAEGRGVSIEVTAPAELAAACDERRVSQVLRALLDNAVKFSPVGGTVTVGLTAETKGDGDGEDIVVTIADEGPGIPPDELDRVFERFFRGNGGSHKSGTGLGLSIARDMVELMGGTLTVRSDRGAGSAFTVRMPRIQG
jgi:signal transduction histidine kinase/HAMP domain-containing protein